ncbi:MAG: adenylate/guanylate cyclase domain-containing protein [Alphaproteobacteria bacterium]
MSHLKFSTKIIIVLSFIVFLIFALQAAWSIQQNDNDRRNSLKLRAELITEIQSISLSGPLWDFDQERALSSLKGLLTDPDIIKATVHDDSGELFVQIKSSNDQLFVNENNTPLKLDKKINFSPTQVDRKLVGKITVFMSTTRIDHALRQDIIGSSIVAFFITMIMICGLVLAIRGFTKPIVDMTTIMRRRANSDYSSDVRTKYLNRADEIGDIARSLEQDQQNRRDEARLLETTRAIATELNLDTLLRQIMEASSALLNAERSTLFLYDEKKNLLWSRFAEGIEGQEIELQPGEGIAGFVWQTGNPEIVKDPYNDPRFDKSVDALTGFQTKEILCLPIQNREGKIIGVTQALNKIDGAFTERDMQRLTSLTAQVSAALENAQLFENVLSMRNYNESILRSLTNGVISLDKERRVQKINSAAERILGHSSAAIEGQFIKEVIGKENQWVLDTLDKVESSGLARQVADSSLNVPETKGTDVNLSAAPLMDLEDIQDGFLTVFEDISKEKRVRNTMARYMPGPIVNQLLEQAEENLRGSLQTVTILFSDIRGFTTTSEKIGARATVAMLNEYLSLMVELIEQNDGILDKYIGDAIMALFGAPFPSTNDAKNAVLTAWDMLETVDLLNKTRVARGEAKIHIGLGINTGEVVVGNIGSERRMDYTVIGDAVNLAARLESATKQYSSKLLISEFTFKNLPEKITKKFRHVDLMRVKGKTQPVTIYEGLDQQHTLSGHIDEWDQALRAYRQQNWKLAQKIFKELLHISQKNSKSYENESNFYGDPVSQLYLNRIAHFENNAPDKNWDGVYVMESK